MPVRRTTAVIAGGQAVLQGLPNRTSIMFQNQAAAARTMALAFPSGFTIKNIAQWGTVFRDAGAGRSNMDSLQGAITITGTNGDTYDVEETYT